MTSPVVLGLWDGHEASVSLLAEGRLIFALSEERTSRRKRASGFPEGALGAALRFADQRGLEVTDVALAGRHGRAPLRLLDHLYRRTSPERDPLSLSSVAVRAWESLIPRATGFRALEAALGRLAPLRRVARLLPRPFRIHVVAHHDAHAWSALFGAHDASALVLTWDAYGEGLAASARFAGSPERLNAALPVSAGLAMLYGAVTHALGFKEGDEGKVMGLAGRGRPEVAAGRVGQLFRTDTAAPSLVRPLCHAELRRLVKGLSREDVAAGLQAATQREVTRWLRSLLSGGARPSRLLLAGGLFANIRVNQALEREDVGGVYVFPNMVDGGLSAGAAHKVWYERSHGLAAEPATLQLGPEMEAARITRAVASLSDSSLQVAERGPAAARMATRIARGEVIALADGRDEFGPRALGARSILFSASRRGLPERVNRGLGRDGFMPFGPAVLAEAAEGMWSEISAASDLSSMTLAVDASPDFARRFPSAVHVDGTTRPQVVRAESAPQLHELLSRLRAMGEAPVLINTSFNRHGEPIVHSPEDALKTFTGADIDALFIGDYEITRAEQARPRRNT
mgnify:CR=1 FL=1